MLSIRGLVSEDVWDYEHGYLWFSETYRFAKLLAHYELYKRILDLPGDVFELGVYKGTSLIRWISFRDIAENHHSRRIFAFDAFGKFPTGSLSKHQDLAAVETFVSEGGDGLSTGELAQVLAYKNLDQCVELIEGDVRETLTAHLGAHPATRLALLHLDLDTYEPTLFALDVLWDRIVPGGIVIVDDYNGVKGATDALDEFLRSRGLQGPKKLGLAHSPTFVTKPCT